ncbi:MAG TPA: hypothetical protein VJM78_01035 [Rhizomicrobium sp.]|nr:hypothetical protein [Rhizomicrobium sp.]
MTNLVRNIGSAIANPQIPFGLANRNSLIEYRAQVQAHADDFLHVRGFNACACGVWQMKRPSFAAGATPNMEVVH